MVITEKVTHLPHGKKSKPMIKRCMIIRMNGF